MIWIGQLDDEKICLSLQSKQLRQWECIFPIVKYKNKSNNDLESYKINTIFYMVATRNTTIILIDTFLQKW